MKPNLFIAGCVMALSSLCSIVYAQDVVIFKNGEETEAKVEEVSRDSIRYKKASNPDGPTYSVPVSDVFMIKYANGKKDVFADQPVRNEPPVVRYYSKKDPVTACLLSWLLPGGGQYYNGEYAKGALMTGLSLGSLLGMVAGATPPAEDYSGDDYYRSGSDGRLAFFALIYLGNYIWSVVDAPISSNKINRRNRMLSWSVGKNVQLSISPDVQLTSHDDFVDRFSPVYGAKLSLSIH
jgi:hypothetical protein